MREPRVIAEIGCNHKGVFSIAQEMIQIAKIYCKADIVKFQKRNIREVLSEAEYYSPHPNPVNSFGNNYGEHREFLEFTIEQHAELKKYCESINITYSSSVWDLTSTKEIIGLSPLIIKIPSACNTNFKILDYICENFGGEIHISLGMTTYEEEETIVAFLENKGRNLDTVLYACTSGYPIPFEDVCLLEVTRLKGKFGNVVKEIGFSGHHLGIAVDIAAYTLGASCLERHFSLDRTWRGTDHAASLEPDGLRRLIRNLKAVNKALTYKNGPILEIEVEQRKKLKWNRHSEK